jgi:peptidoglycan/xylan/chitin deacetylase (PgdA/CDA1 family)
MTCVTLTHPSAMSNIDADAFEHRPAYRRTGIYLPALFILGIATAILGYLLAMQTLGWRTPILGALGGISKSNIVQQGTLLYVSPNSKTYFGSIGGNYETLIIPWRNYFVNRNISVKEVSDIAELSNIREGVLILPSAVALSEQERADILRFHAAGGAVLATWATGSRDDKNVWQGWGFMEALGVKVLGEIPLEPAARQLILNGESPVSHQSGAGMRIWLGNASESFLRLKGNGIGARIMDWGRTPDKTRSGEGAIIYSENVEGAGRSVAFAFAESAWEAQSFAAYQVVDDTIAWLQRKPAIVKAAWPNGKRAAQLIEMDTEQGFPNALRFASMMRALNYRGSFYVLTSVGQQFPDVLLSLARDFDVGYHGDVHEGFKDQSSEQQQKRIETMLSQMKTVIPDSGKFTGFRAPFESFDATTNKLLQKNGIRHHVIDPAGGDVRLPSFIKQAGVGVEEALIALPRTTRDDINLAKENLTTEQITQALIDDFDLAQDMGGMGLLSIHSQNYSNDAPLTLAMPGFLKHLTRHKDEVWMASATDIANWWRERERFKLSARNLGRRLEFNITITGKTPLEGGSLTVMLPRKGIMPIVQSLKVGMPTATVQRIDDFRAAITFGPLRPGDYAYQATFE